MSSRADPVVNNLTPTNRDAQEHIFPIGVLHVFVTDDEPARSIQHSTHECSEPPEPPKHSDPSEHSYPPELYDEIPTTDEASPTLEARVPVIKSIDAYVKDPPPVVVSTQGNTVLMEAAASRASSLGPGASPPPYPSDGDFTTRGNLLFSSPYLLSRFFTIDHYNESLRHEAGIAASEGRIRGGRDMFVQRLVELIVGIDTLFNEEPQTSGV